jgi:hypothetical protein
MVFSIDSVVDLKKSAAEVWKSLDERRPSREVVDRFADLVDKWESPAVVLFRRAYGNACASMPDHYCLAVWKRINEGMNGSRCAMGFIDKIEYREFFYSSLTTFLNYLCVVESAHIPDINKHYRWN